MVGGEVMIGRVGEGGGQVVFAIAGPGEVFGELSLFDNEGERTADAQALKSTVCLVIAKAPLLRFLTAQPRFAAANHREPKRESASSASFDATRPDMSRKATSPMAASFLLMYTCWPAWSAPAVKT